MRRWIGAAAGLAGLALPAAGPAQSLPDQLSQPIDPVERRVEAVSAPEARPAAEPVGPEAVGEGPAFVLRGIALDGATALGPAELAPLWAGLVGQPVTLAALEAVAAAVTARYREAGYVLSQAVVPAQVVEDGVVTIQVIEGFVDRVRVEGGPPAAAAFAERRLGALAGERPLAIGRLERGVLLARDALGGTVETVLAPSEATFGAADMVVVLEPDPVAGFAAADNRGSRLYGDVSLAAGVTLYGLLGLTEQLEFIAAGEPGGAIRFGSGAVELPLAALDGGALDGARLRLAGEGSRATPDLARAGAVDGFETTLDEAAAAAVVTVPFVRTRAASVFGRIGIDWRRSRNATLFAGDEARSTDELLVLEAGVSWDRADRAGGVTILDLAIRQGLDFGPVRIGNEGPGAPDAGFTRAGVRVARVQRLGDGGWSVFGEVIGQAASGVLPGAERFSLGGATIGRGFAPGNTSGDSGLAGRLELRRLVALPGEGAAELYAFGDYGETRNRSDASGLPARQTIGSVGFGARVDVAPWLTLTPEVVRQTSGRAVDTTSPGLETRFFIGAVARF